MIISIDTENTFDKIHCAILTKIFNEVEIFLKNLFDLIKGLQKKKSTVNIVLNEERILSPQIRNKARIPFLPPLFSLIFSSLLCVGLRMMCQPSLWLSIYFLGLLQLLINGSGICNIQSMDIFQYCIFIGNWCPLNTLFMIF